jgi:hypothetical protein
MNIVKRIAAGALVAALAVGLTACATQENKSKLAVEKFRQSTSGQFEADSGAQLFIAPVRARMVTDEAVYLERHDANGNVFGRLLNVEMSADGKKILLRAFTFTQEGQWRNLRENPELFTALLPKDVRPAGTCDIQPSEDMNSLTYSCGGTAPETFRRKVQ